MCTLESMYVQRLVSCRTSIANESKARVGKSKIVNVQECAIANFTRTAVELVWSAHAACHMSLPWALTAARTRSLAGSGQINVRCFGKKEPIVDAGNVAFLLENMQVAQGLSRTRSIRSASSHASHVGTTSFRSQAPSRWLLRSDVVGHFVKHSNRMPFKGSAGITPTQ